jgi:hypothetical protein
MKEEIKHIWIDALTSGEFHKAQGILRNDKYNTYCCLGVLCELHRRITNKGGWNGAFYFDKCGHLPEQVQEWSGIESTNAEYKNSNLVMDNDSGKSFISIAQIIENNF